MNRKTIFILTLIAMVAVVARATSRKTDELYTAVKSAIETSFGLLSTKQIDSIFQIIKAWNIYGDGDVYKLAYILATAWHESKLISQKEIRCNPAGSSTQRICYERQAEYWDTGYYGRGYVQLTHYDNYLAMGTVFGLDLVTDPDAALEPELSAKILVFGMMSGSFTGKPLSNYINQFKKDFVNARRVVNGTDQAQLISEYAVTVLNNLKEMLPVA